MRILKGTTLLTKFGVIGTVITAVCCFTPVLVILLGIMGLSWLTGYLDYILIPALLIFICITIYAVSRNAKPGEANKAL